MSTPKKKQMKTKSMKGFFVFSFFYLSKMEDDSCEEIGFINNIKKKNKKEDELEYWSNLRRFNIFQTFIILILIIIVLWRQNGIQNILDSLQQNTTVP